MTADKGRFGEAMRSHRKARSLTLNDVVAELAARGHTYTPQAVSAWERGESAPPADVVRVVEDVLTLTRGTLGIELGLPADEPLRERLDAIQASLDEQRAETAEIRRLLERLLDAPPEP